MPAKSIELTVNLNEEIIKDMADTLNETLEHLVIKHGNGPELFVVLSTLAIQLGYETNIDCESLMDFVEELYEEAAEISTSDKLSDVETTKKGDKNLN